MYITAQCCRLRNDLYYVEWDVKLYYTIPIIYFCFLHVCCVGLVVSTCQVIGYKDSSEDPY